MPWSVKRGLSLPLYHRSPGQPQRDRVLVRPLAGLQMAQPTGPQALRCPQRCKVRSSKAVVHRGSPAHALASRNAGLDGCDGPLARPKSPEIREGRIEAREAFGLALWPAESFFAAYKAVVRRRDRCIIEPQGVSAHDSDELAAAARQRIQLVLRG